MFASIFLLFDAQLIAYAQQSAEDDPVVKAVPLPPGVPAIPAPEERDKVLLLTGKNEPSYQDILLAPLAAWLREGKLAMRVVRNLEFAWRYAPAFEETSRRNQTEFDLGPDFSLVHRAADAPQEGLPFGFAEEINQEGDPVRKAYKILWNAAYVEGAARDVYYQSEFAWIGTQSILRSARAGLYRRTYFTPPEGTPVNDPKDIFRRELLRFFSPPVVATLTQFTFRSRGTEPDEGALYSPVLKRLRPLMPANRTDPILGGNLSTDDLFVWSAKVQSVFARVVDEKVLLVPFPAVSYYKIEQGSFSELPPAADSKPESVAMVKGFHQRSDGLAAMVLWNYQSRQLPQLAPWVPTTASFVPRRVWIIELSPKNPYSAYGREILMVDQESLLPVYKLVYDRIGEYRKTVFGAWGLARSRDGKLRFPFSAFVVAVDQSSQSVNVVTTEQVQTFVGKDTRGAQAVRAWMDPDKYPKKEKSEPVSEKSEVSDDEAAPAPLDD